MWVLTGLWGMLLAAGTILWPATYGLDESQHIDMTYAYSQSLHLYDPGELVWSAGVTGIQQYYVGHPPKRSMVTATIPARGSRPSLGDLGGNQRVGIAENPMVQHPPAYYLLAGAVLRVPGVANLPFDQVIGLIRLFSLLCLLPLPALCWLTVRRLGGSEPIALAAGMVPLGVPGLLRTGAVVTNDSLLVLGSSVLTYLLVRVLTGDLRRRTAAGVAVALAIALLSKGLALVLPLVVAVSYLVAARRYRARPLAPLGIAALGGVAGGLWYLRNLLRYDAVQPSGFHPGYDGQVYGPATFNGRLANFVPGFLRGFFGRMFDGLGIPDKPAQAPLLVWGWIAILAIGLLVTVLVRRPPPLTRATAVVLLLPFTLASLLIFTGSWGDYHRYGVFTGVHGRYAYLGIAGLVAVAVTGLGQLIAPAFHRRLPLAVFAAALLTELTAFVVINDDWFTLGQDTLVGRLHQGAATMLRISPWPAPLTALPFVAAAGLTVACLVLLVRQARVEPTVDTAS
jgi:hypothetical protein